MSLSLLISLSLSLLISLIAQWIGHADLPVRHSRSPHQSKDNAILIPNSPADSESNPVRADRILCKQRLGGLLKFYHRKAA
jgi:hypothetical protein